MPATAPDAKLPERRKANKAEAAEFFAVSLASIDSWLRRGCPYVQRGEKGRPWVLDLLAVALWRHGAEPTEDDPEKMSPKERLDWYRGTRERLALLRDQGELVPADEVAEAWLSQISVAKGRLLSLPVRVAPDLLGQSEPRDIERALKSAISEVLEELANG